MVLFIAILLAWGTGTYLVIQTADTWRIATGRVHAMPKFLDTYWLTPGIQLHRNEKFPSIPRGSGRIWRRDFDFHVIGGEIWRRSWGSASEQPRPRGTIAYDIWIPYWGLALVTPILPLGWVLQSIVRQRAARRPGCGICVRCGYDLRATPQRCPECGTVPKPEETT
jgi:hypothetical protein